MHRRPQVVRQSSPMQLGAGDRHGGAASFVNSFISIMGLMALFKNLIPPEWWYWFEDRSSRIFTFLSIYGFATINEVNGGVLNEIYDEAELYVTDLVRARAPRSLALSRAKNEAMPSYALVDGEAVEDSFEGTKFIWKHFTREREHKNSSMTYFLNGRGEEKRFYYLKFHKKHQDTLFRRYLEHVRMKALQLGHQKQERMLYTNQKKDDYYSWRAGKAWKGVPFKHPSSFSSIAMNPQDKKQLTDDLTTFMSAGDFYQRVGRAWKRGYLLYGPPGTGKSSLIAAMANFTRYDVYDLELTAVSNNTDLRKLLMAVPSRSIIVIEDIDCSVELKKRGKPAKEEREKKPGEEKDDKKEKELTLSGLLNFTDGLWSCCGEQRIIIFTTNFVEMLDPALLRPGRMDFHIRMSYCCFEAFKVLALTHLQEEDHPLFEEIREFLPPKASEVEVTPANIAEALVRNRGEGADVTLQRLLEELKDPNSELRQKKVEKPVVEEEKQNVGEGEAGDTSWLGMSG